MGSSSSGLDGFCDRLDSGDWAGGRVIPAWKLRREMLRLWRMLTFLPMHPVEQAWFRLHPHLFPATPPPRP